MNTVASQAFNVGTKVRIVRRGAGGHIEIDFGSESELNRIYEALTGGIAVLDAAGQPRAAASRVRLILAMYLPPLVDLARDHADDAYRRELGAFARTLGSRADGVVLSEPAATALAAARLW